jgi:hypothetical protein
MATPPYAREAAPGALFDEVSMLREFALQVLERMSADRDSSGTRGDAVVALQTAANQLGDAENALAEPESAAADSNEPDPDGWTAEAAAIVTLAEFSLPYARSRAAEAELWLRVLRGDGAVGRALEELGYPRGQLLTLAEPVPEALQLDAVTAVRSRASDFTLRRGAPAVTSVDVLFAVLDIYDTLLDRALFEHGITRQELIDHIGERHTAEQTTGVTAAPPSLI